MSNLAQYWDKAWHGITWRRKRLWRRTLGRRTYERKQLAYERKQAEPSLYRVGQLVSPEATLDDLELAATMLDALLPEMYRPPRHAPGLVVNHAIAFLERGASTEDAVGRVRRFAAAHRTLAEPTTCRFIDYLRDSDRFDTAVHLAHELYDATGLATYGAALHRLQVHAGDCDGAHDTVARLATDLAPHDATPSLLRAEELLDVDDHVAALDELASVRPTFSREYSRRRIQAHVGLGQHQAILDYLDGVDPSLPTTEVHLRRFDALFSLGRRSEAEAELDAIGDDDVDERVVDRVAKAHGHAAAQALLDRLMAGVGVATDDPVKLEAAGIVLFRSNHPREAVDALRRADAAEPLRPFARRVLAQSLYSLREFEAALVEIDKLRGTTRHWPAMKLRGRILIELGRPDEALENREESSRPGDDTDEVAYHTLLALGRHAEAFSRQPFVADLRSLRADFGDWAEAHPTESVARRFVVADAGPGDEIQDASGIGELLEISKELILTCDPRLQTLLARSFPDVEFIPVERLRNPPHFASHSPGAVPRSGTAMDRLLTAEAYERARACDRVALGRAVKSLRDVSAGPRPAPPFLVPDPARIAEDGRGENERPTVGLVWRSELQTSWRAIHYLEAGDLEPLTALDATVICLQHDVSDGERVVLEQMFGERVVFADDIDLRNDFEETAALLSDLDLTIGVGTTMTNLAAAVGCPTIMMQPTHFGTWLATDEAGSDFWYQCCTVVSVDPPHDIEMLVQRTRDIALEHLFQKSSSSP